MADGQNASLQDDKVYAAMSYLWVLSLFPLLMKRGRPFVQAHAKQGFLLFLAEVVIGIVGVVPVLGWLVGFVGGLVAAIFSVMGVLNALQGKEWEMPILGQYAKTWKF